MKKYGNDTLSYIDCMNELVEMFYSILNEVESEERESYDTPMFATSFRGSDLTEEEESALDHLFDMMTAVKQQVLLRKALHNENKKILTENEIRKELIEELSANVKYLNFQQTMKYFEGTLNKECENCGVQPAFKTLL